jgi:hypothetical protein
MLHLRKLIILILLIFSNSFVSLAEDSNKRCAQFFSPFLGQDRSKYQTIVNRCFSEYGDYRSSNIRGHKHAGIDLRGKLNEKVYPKVAIQNPTFTFGNS